jgi:transcriptional regulator with XRE-family HTH domain
MARSLIYKTFGHAVRQYRLSRGMSQEDFAAMLDVTQRSITLWERGGAPRIPKIVQLEEIMGVSLWSLIAKDARGDDA